MAADLGIFLAVTAMLSWGVADFLAKKAIDKIGYKTSIVINQLVAFIPAVVFAVLFFKIPSLTVELAAITVVAGITGVIGYIFMYRGFQRGNLSVVAPITASWAVITALLAVFLFQETLSPIQIVGIIAVFFGIFFTSTNLTELRASFKQRKVAGVSDAVIAMIAWGISYALLKPITSAVGPIMALLFLKLAAVAVLFSWTGATKTKISLPSKTVFFFIGAAGLLDFLAYLSFNFSLTTQYVSIVSSIVATALAVTIALAYVFLKEHLVRNQKIGIIAILAGIILISLA